MIEVYAAIISDSPQQQPGAFHSRQRLDAVLQGAT
jgi:hypothetical protein